MRVRTTSSTVAPASPRAVTMISKHRLAWMYGSGSTDPSGQTGAVPDTTTRSPMRMARQKPIVFSKGDPELTRRRSVFRGSGSAERKQLQLLESILNRGTKLGDERLQPLLGWAVRDVHHPDPAESCLQGVQAGRLVAGHPGGRAANLARHLLVAMPTHPGRQARGGDEHALRLRVERRRHDLSWPSRLEQGRDLVGPAQRGDPSDHVARAENDENARAGEQDDDRCNHPGQHSLPRLRLVGGGWAAVWHQGRRTVLKL